MIRDDIAQRVIEEYQARMLDRSKFNDAHISAMRHAIEFAGLVERSELEAEREARERVEREVANRAHFEEQYRQRASRLEAMLLRARDAIASLPIDALGAGGDGTNVEFYPIRDELIHRMTQALAESEERGAEGSGLSGWPVTVETRIEGHGGPGGPNSGTRNNTPDPAEQENGKQQAACHLYQVLGTLLSDTGQFDSERGSLVLDTILWIAGERDEPGGWDGILPFDSVEPEEVGEALLYAVPEDATGPDGEKLYSLHESPPHGADYVVVRARQQVQKELNSLERDHDEMCEAYDDLRDAHMKLYQTPPAAPKVPSEIRALPERMKQDALKNDGKHMAEWDRGRIEATLYWARELESTIASIEGRKDGRA